MFWFNYNNTISLNKKWGLTNDVQLRTREWASHWSQFALRTGITYKINPKFSAAAGFTWFGNVRYYNNEPLVADEWRPWQELTFQIANNKRLFLQRLRLEERFLQKVVNGKKTNDFENRERLRYRLEVGFHLSKKTELHIANEVMGNINYIADNRFFDQNRTFAFVNYKISASTFLQYQFLKIFQWQPAINTMEDQNVFRFSVHQQF
ncbi:MAG: DUF2490 domain-containing protein [Ferruginibacter sp.]